MTRVTQKNHIGGASRHLRATERSLDRAASSQVSAV